MNKIYFLFAFFAGSVLSVNCMEDENPIYAYSPHNSDSVIESVYSSYLLKKPLELACENNTNEPEQGACGAIILIRCKAKDTNWDDYGKCNYPQCDALLHKSCANNHARGHIKNNPRYADTKDKTFFSQLRKTSTLHITTKDNHELKVERLN